MGVSIAVTRAAANTSTGTQDITSDDLGGLTPKAVLLIATRGVTDGTAADGAGMYWGASDGTNEWAQSYESQHAQASMNMQMTQDANADRILTIHNGAAASTVDATADFDSFIANGVRIDWTDAPASAFLITAVFFAGTDLSAQVGNQDLGTTPDDLIAITSVGFEADVLITTVLRTLNQGGPSFGFVHNNRAGTVVQRGIGHKQRDGFGSSSVTVVMREDSCFVQMLSTDSLDWFGTAQSFDTDGFDIQLGNSRGAANSDIGWIALRFGTSPVVSSKVYTYSTPTGTGANTDSTPDFEPQFAMYLANRAAAADTLETDADGGTIGVVMVDADDLYTQSISDEDAAADSNTQSLSDNILNLPTHTGASGHEATLTSMGSTGPVWSYSATNGTARLWAALAIGVEAAGGITEDVNQASETDTAQALGKSKSKSIGINSETDTAQSIAKSKAKVIGLNSETDSAQSIAAQRSYPVGQPSETDAAQAFSSRKVKAAGLVSEADTSLSIAAQRVYPVGLPSEADSALAFTSRKILAVDLPSETDTSLSISAQRAYALGLPAETDAALSITARKVVAVGIAEESDSALGMGTQQAIDVGQALESDTAQAITAAKVVAIGILGETDLAQALFPLKRVAVGLASEADAALGITVSKRAALGLAVEADSVFAVTSQKRMAIGIASETDLAQALVTDEGIGRAIHTYKTQRNTTYQSDIRRQDRTQEREVFEG